MTDGRTEENKEGGIMKGLRKEERENKRNKRKKRTRREIKEGRPYEWFKDGHG